jgi:hypothetical protein
MTWLFEQYLFATKHRNIQPLPEEEQITEEDVEQVNELLQTFAESLDDDDDLGTYFRRLL